MLKRALALQERALGASNPELAETLLGLAELHLAARKPEEAAPLLERALALDGKKPLPEVDLALADALWSLRRDRPLALAREARAEYARRGHRPGLAKADRWLAEHPDDAVASAGAGDAPRARPKLNE